MVASVIIHSKLFEVFLGEFNVLICFSLFLFLVCVTFLKTKLFSFTVILLKAKLCFKIFGYFYETNNFFDVRNDNVVKVQNNKVSYVNIFPNDKGSINQRPFLNIIDIKSLNFSRLIKNDSSVDFTKTLNYIGYVGDCYYRELKTGVEVQLTGIYTTNRKMSDVWKIEILDTLDSIPSYSSPQDTPISQKIYEVKDFGDKKTGFSESKYLKIVHKNMEVSNAFLENKASITLTSSLGTEEYKSYTNLL